MIRGRAENNNAPNKMSSGVILHPQHSDTVEGSGQAISELANHKSNGQTVIMKGPEKGGSEKHTGSEIPFTTSPAHSPLHPGALDQAADRSNNSVTGYPHSSMSITSKEALTHTTNKEQFKESQTPDGNVDSLYGLTSSVNSQEFPIQNNAFASVTNLNETGPGGPCELGLSSCVFLPNFNGTNLLWDDMRRTLTFAWDLHVYGSASLFILMAALAVMGMSGARTIPRPVCDTLTLANCLLALSGTLRGVLLLLDPYGTRQMLSRATLAALHNAPLQLFLWAQVALALFALKGLNSLPEKLQHPCMVGGLSVLHCTLLFVADLSSSTLSPALPLLLQTLSLCWGLLFFMGILAKSCAHLHPFLGSSVPQWAPSHRIEKCAKRVTAVCSFLGVMCCSLQMYSLLWLYGLLGNWRRFGWGWWLSQFSARILELAWGFSLLVLGSWIFWMPSRGHPRADQTQSRSEMSGGIAETHWWSNIIASIRKGPLTKSEKNWEDLMPGNWAKCSMTTTGFGKNVMCPYDDQPSTVTSEYRSDPVSKTSPDSQAALLWQKVGERECILSLIEFDMRPPSPINLRRSIDNALYHGQLVAGGLFTPPPPSWTHSVSSDAAAAGENATTVPPAYAGYRWTLDTESTSPSLDHFQAKEPTLSAAATTGNADDESPAAVRQREEFISASPAVTYEHDWSEDDVTNL
ncbi:uncharacterized protein V6R79_013808 [Siganus canaliculatus]